ncbi:phosphatase 2c [Anaeramoeba flamelloides]|uniref:Phosphatase 2c n=1 Tax=Anaeramoeba flamelloides TaxID=1746091 RepID=A0AAV7ZLW8_9EUKA|nr:phosphatase 2c [Anaeramoeba flamelloides]
MSQKPNPNKYQNLVSVKSCGVIATRNSRFRRTMEDAHIVVDKLGDKEDQGFFGVYDGHGGSQASNFCKEHLHIEFQKLLKEKEEKEEKKEEKEQEKEQQNEKETTEEKENIDKITEIWKKTYYNIDFQLKNNGIEYPGTTVITSFIRKEEEKRVLYTANVGDARGVLCRNGVAQRLSFDHKASVVEEQERIINQGGFITNNRVVGMIAITRSLGDHSIKEYIINEPYTSRFELTEEDKFIILACDGVWDVMEDQDVVDLVKDMKHSQEMAKKILMTALDKGSTDNISEFTYWINRQLTRRGMWIENFEEQLFDGVILCHVLEIITEKDLKFKKNPKNKIIITSNFHLIVQEIQKSGVNISVNVSGK